MSESEKFRLLQQEISDLKEQKTFREQMIIAISIVAGLTIFGLLTNL